MGRAKAADALVSSARTKSSVANGPWRRKASNAALEAAQGDAGAMSIALAVAQDVLDGVIQKELGKDEPDIRVTLGLTVIKRTLTRWEAAL